MKERTTPYITIKKPDGSTLAVVTIEATSVRKFALMGDDYLRLDFQVVDPVHIPVGAYIDDEIFGRFVATEEQLPKYNEATASYTYNFRFDAPYKAWANFLHMMTAEVDGVNVRKESDWTLTQNLEKHAAEIIKGLALVGFAGYSVTIDDTATHAAEAKTLTYNGVSILEAIKNLADTFETEYLVDCNEKTIYFGKVETGDAITLSLATNVKSMEIQRDREKYANKLYVYGGDVNLPTTYRRKLIITLQSSKVSQGVTLWTPDKRITPDMVAKDISGRFTFADELPGSTTGAKVVTSTANITTAGEYNVSLQDFSFEWPYIVFNGSGSVSASATLDIMLDGVVIASYAHTYRTTADYNPQMFVSTIDQLQGFDVDKQLSIGNHTAKIELNVSVTGATITGVGACKLGVGSIGYTMTTNAKSDVVPCVLNGSTKCYIVFNPLEVRRVNETTFETDPDWYAFAFCDSKGVVLSAAISGVKVGATLEVNDDGFSSIPTAFYALPYDNPSSLYNVGATRLKMPTADFVTTEDYSQAGAVEDVVVFNDIYPDGKLKVEAIAETERKDHTEYEGESERTDWTWTQYALSLKMADGKAFPFKLDYMLPGTLKVRFLTPADVNVTNPGDGYKLAGMTFEVAFNKYRSQYTIVRNNDYGTTLPNDTLKPSVGDACVLEGWNPKAVKGLGLIADAESRLAAKAQEYAEALNQPQFVFTCTMSSGFLFDAYGDRLALTDGSNRTTQTIDAKVAPINDSDGKALKDGDNLQLKAVVVPGYEVTTEAPGKTLKDSDGAKMSAHNVFDRFLVIGPGQKAIVQHSALKSAVTSRVIGFEYKVDKPYDAPKLTIGETSAYSRLAQIEKQITKLK